MDGDQRQLQLCDGTSGAKMVTITPSLHGDELHLDAEGMDTLRLDRNKIVSQPKTITAK